MNWKLTLASEFKLPTGLLGASLGPDGRSLAAACMDGLYLADLDAKASQRIGEHDSYASSVAFTATQKTIISAGYDGAIQWFDTESHQQQRRVDVHSFWSWDMAISPDEKTIASVTGQYLAGGYKYEPLPEREPSVCLLSVETGEVLHRLPHVPSVQAVAFSPDSQFVAAGNLMGEVRVYHVATGEPAAQFTTDAFTSWGIIKSHCYLGGIFSMRFTPDGEHLLLAGMGPMRDPMAGNGRQLWQKWHWQGRAEMVDQTHKGESGEGLMEALAIHPAGEIFGMGGRLRGGDWNVALFDLATGNRLTHLKTGFRVTELLFNTQGDRLVVAGTQGQPGKQKDGKFPRFGRLQVYEVA